MTEKNHSHVWSGWSYSEEYHAPIHRCVECGERQSAFAWQEVAPIGKVETKKIASKPKKPPPAPKVEAKPENPQSDAPFLQMFDGIKATFAEKVQAGEFTPGRHRFLENILNEFEAIMHSEGDDLAAILQRPKKIQDLMKRCSEAFANPAGIQEAKENLPERGKFASSRVSQFKKFVIGEQAQPHWGESDREALMSLTGRSVEAQNDVVNLKDDNAVLNYEKESLRHLALDIKQYALRNHLTIAQPIWRAKPVAQNPNAVFYCGGEKVQKLLEKTCKHLQLQLLENSGHKNYPQNRWDMLRSSHIAVFDFTSYMRDAPVEKATLAASVAYELGIALTLGSAVLVVAMEGQDLPFDVDVQSLRLQNNKEDTNCLTEAIDDLLYEHQRCGAEDSISATYEYLQIQLQARKDAVTKKWLGDLSDSVKDPVKFRHLYDVLSSRTLNDQYLSITPTWTGSYPQGGKKCFHVTAYRDYTKSTAEIIARICARPEVGIEYLRGDEMTSTDIISAIWDDLSRSDFIVADITSLNSNTLLELAMAHTLGRKSAIITQDATPMHRPESIKKLRVINYALNDKASMQALETYLFNFFTSRAE